MRPNYDPAISVSVHQSQLLERSDDLATLAEALDGVRLGQSGATLLIGGPAGVGKTALLDQVATRALADGYRVLRARGSEIEREFGFGLVRQLWGPLLNSLDAERQAELFDGPARLAAAVFGLGGEGLEVGAAEDTLYGLFWLLAREAEEGPVLLGIDDAHWSDGASLRFVRYLGRRLEGLPVLVVLATRPNEPGAAAELLRGLEQDSEMRSVRPAPLSEAGTAALVRRRLGPTTTKSVEKACHEATGGNPFLIGELLTELADGADPPSPGRIATIGPERLAAGIGERAERLDPFGRPVARAAAVLGDAANLRAVATLAGVDRERAASIVDGLAAAAILGPGPDRRFFHPLVRTAVYEGIPDAARGDLHARAATVLAEQGARPETAAAHLLLSRAGGGERAAEILDDAARSAAERGAPESAIAYLRRALEEITVGDARAELLHRLAGVEVVVRDPAAIGHLQEAAGMTSDDATALEIYLELADVLALAGQWEATIDVVESSLARFGATGLPGVIELEGYRAAFRAYDPAHVDELDADLPRLRKLAAGRTDERSEWLRWTLAAVGARGELPREEVLTLVDPTSAKWRFRSAGRESSAIGQALFALISVDAFDHCDHLAEALLEDGRDRGSLLGTTSGLGIGASAAARQGRLDSAEADMATAVELIEENQLGLMAMTTMFHFCIDVLIERPGMDRVARLVEELELPPAFNRTQSGGVLLEARGAIRTALGDRDRGLADLRDAGRILGALRNGPRFSSWRSRLALALPDDCREEALALVAEELELARRAGSPRAIGVAQRGIGTLAGGEEGIATLRRSAMELRDSPARLEFARSLTELGAALRRANQRKEARKQLTEAADLAQRCGAERLAERIDEELLVAGARKRGRARSGIPSLTPGERRVADAAGRGATNREIAQNLFISVRTVEMHLTNTYRKLDISSRAELAAMIDEDARRATAVTED